MNPSLKQSSTSSGMHKQSKGYLEIPPIFWRFVSKQLKHTGKISYPNPQSILFLPHGMAKTAYISLFIYKVNQEIAYKPTL
jgi:hypothetical protein